MNRNRQWIGTVLLLAAGLSVASADVIYLKDGTVREGEIVRRDPEGQFLILKVDQRGITATMRIDYGDIHRIDEGRTRAEVLVDEYENRLRHADAGQNPVMFEALARWCRRNKMHKEAIEAFTRVGELDEKRALGAGMGIARVRMDQGRPDLARHALKALQIQHPKHPLITGMLADLDDQAKKVAADMIALAVDRFRQERYGDSIAILNRLQRIRDPKVLDQANTESRRELGWTVAELMATNRIHRRCPHCSPNLRAGFVVCPTCKGKCFFEKTEQVVELIEGKSGQPSRKRIFNRLVKKPCPQCKGFGYIICPHCHGGGRNFGDIGDLERPVFVTMLRKGVDALQRRLAGELDQKATVHLANCEVVVLKTRRLEYFLGHMFMLDAQLKGDSLQKYVRLRRQNGDLLREAVSCHRRRSLKDAEKYDAFLLERFIIEEGILLPEAE